MKTHADVLAALAVILETHVETSQAKGLTPLLDGVELARVVRAIVDHRPSYSPDLVGARERLIAVMNGQHANTMAPDIYWTAPAEQSSPSREGTGVVDYIVAAVREREEWIDMGTPLARVDELNDQIKTLRAAAAILAESESTRG